MGLVLVKEYTLNLDLSPIQDYVHNVVLKTSLSSKKSNVGGWQSPILWSWSEELKELQTFVEKEIPNYTLQSLWFNYNGYGHYNHMHEHHKGKDAISGVYYIEVPDENMGKIYFKSGEEYEPMENRLLLFPADLKHGVRKNQSHKKRISLAFNYQIITRSGITI
mgnify:CR=1 FL=1